VAEDLSKYIDLFGALNNKFLIIAQDRTASEDASIDRASFDKASFQLNLVMEIGNLAERSRYEFITLQGYFYLVSLMGTYEGARKGMDFTMKNCALTQKRLEEVGDRIEKMLKYTDNATTALALETKDLHRSSVKFLDEACSS